MRYGERGREVRWREEGWREGVEVERREVRWREGGEMERGR